MKIRTLICLLFVSLSFKGFSQSGPGFTAEQQAQITKILGKEYSPVFSSKGELVIAKGTSINTVKALPGGGFSNLSKAASVAKNELIHKGWILRSSKEALESLKTQLGKQRFTQLEKILSLPGTAATFSSAEQATIKNILGKDFAPVFSAKGELVITKGTAINKVKVLPGGGFSNLSKAASVAKNELIHKGWVYKSSKQVLESLQTQLGQERFNQLEAVLSR